MSCVEVLSQRTISKFGSGHRVKISEEQKDPYAYLHNIIHQDAEEEVSFPGLPPLLRGHSDIHLRAGVMRASRLAAHHEVDAEKAFFVADLSFVYKQHLKWMRHLPHIEPFYGKRIVGI